MKRLLTTLLPIGASAAVAVAAVALTFATAGAFPLRSTQVPMCATSLQNYLNGVGETISVPNDQLNAQVWETSSSGNSTFTLMIELAANANSNSIGIYNTTDGPSPTLFQVFPGAATAGWYATAHFSGGNAVISLFDNTGAFQGQSFPLSVNPNAFGFYLKGPGGTFYGEDSRNAGGKAQIVTYLGHGRNFGGWWECFEDLPYQYPNCLTDFEDAVLTLESVVPTPVNHASWGGMKAIYR